MALVCHECGSLNVGTDGEPPPDDWYALLVTMSDQVPSQEHCEAWLDSKGLSDEAADAVAISMHASLRYDPKKQAWMYNGKPRYDIWRTFQTWMNREVRRNGHQAGTSMIRKEGGRY